MCARKTTNLQTTTYKVLWKRLLVIISVICYLLLVVISIFVGYKISPYYAFSPGSKHQGLHSYPVVTIGLHYL